MPVQTPLPKPTVPNVLTLGGLTVQHGGAGAMSLRLALLLWGDFGTGKTTLACTAPGTKLILNVDPDGYTAIAHRKDIQWVDLVGLTNDQFFNQMQSIDNPLGLDEYLTRNPRVETVILDSATSVRDRALHKSVDMGIGRSKKDGFTPTIEAPGQSAYGGRNAIVLECVSGILRVTAKHRKHVIVIAHEAEPQKDKEGIVQYITMNLGGQLYTGVGYRFSEIWCLHQSATQARTRTLCVRPTLARKPMKTRMFVDRADPSFQFDYDDANPIGTSAHTIAEWYKQWALAGHKKIPLPKPLVSHKPRA